MAKKKIIETAMIDKEEIIETETLEKAETSEIIKAKVIGGKNLNIRADKSTDADKVGCLEDGSMVEIEKKGKEWCKIAGGYIMTRFLEFE